MAEDAPGRQLHDKVTRGGSLTEAEQTELASWYAQQDGEETALLASSSHASPSLDALREEVEEAFRCLQAVTQQVQMQVDENQALRREIVILSQRLT